MMACVEGSLSSTLSQDARGLEDLLVENRPSLTSAIGKEEEFFPFHSVAATCYRAIEGNIIVLLYGRRQNVFALMRLMIDVYGVASVCTIYF